MKKTKRQIMALALAMMTAVSLSACGGSKPAETTAAPAAEGAATEAAGGESQVSEAEAGSEAAGEKKVLRVAMVCAFAHYNWTVPVD